MQSFDNIVHEAHIVQFECHIENADATPPHLNVFVRFGDSVALHGSLQFFAFGQLSQNCGAI